MSLSSFSSIAKFDYNLCYLSRITCCYQKIGSWMKHPAYHTHAKDEPETKAKKKKNSICSRLLLEVLCIFQMRLTLETIYISFFFSLCIFYKSR